MGTIAHRFETGEQSSQKGHFRNLIMLARIDGKVADDEKALLNRIANRLGLTDEQVKEVLDDSNSYPMIPPVSREERYERLIQLVQMIFVDGTIDKKEDILIHRYGIALGFTQEELDEKYPLIVDKVQNGMDRQEILDSIL
jgi:uncharacterized tellurite resistance protein B-like protein